MPSSGEYWLSLKTRPFTEPKGKQASGLFILIPKKRVRLATRRNRIRRLIREAARREGFFKDPYKTYWLTVLQAPESLNFSNARRTLQDLVQGAKP